MQRERLSQNERYGIFYHRRLEIFNFFAEEVTDFPFDAEVIQVSLCMCRIFEICLFSVSVVSRLLTLGWDTQIRDKTLVFRVACQSRNVEVVRRLLELNAGIFESHDEVSPPSIRLISHAFQPIVVFFALSAETPDTPLCLFLGHLSRSLPAVTGSQS